MPHMKFLSLMVQKLWPRITCDTNRAIFRIKVTSRSFSLESCRNVLLVEYACQI